MIILNIEFLQMCLCLQYWNIVPVEHLLARLVVDTEPVNKRIMKLIYTSFVPRDAPSMDIISHHRYINTLEITSFFKTKVLIKCIFLVQVCKKYTASLENL